MPSIYRQGPWYNRAYATNPWQMGGQLSEPTTHQIDVLVHRLDTEGVEDLKRFYLNGFYWFVDVEFDRFAGPFVTAQECDTALTLWQRYFDEPEKFEGSLTVIIDDTDYCMGRLVVREGEA